MSEASEDLQPRGEEVDAFWVDARIHANLNQFAMYMGWTPLETVPPPAWSFGGGPELADRLLALVLDGTKTATAGALWDYEAEDLPVPEPGQLSIVLDSGGSPRALIATTQVQVLPFDQVPADFAYDEGEGDRSLEHWRQAHQRFFTTSAAPDHGFREDMPVVCERFQVLYQR